MAKRIFLFILTNLLVITTIGIVLTIITSVTGVGSYIQNGRIDLMALLVFSLVVGFVGSFYFSRNVQMDGQNDDGRPGVKSEETVAQL